MPAETLTVTDDRTGKTCELPIRDGRREKCVVPPEG